MYEPEAPLLATRATFNATIHNSDCTRHQFSRASYLYWLGGIIQLISLRIKMGDGTNRKYGLLQDLLLIVVSVSVLGTLDLSMPRLLLT
jgi:hypothetical protein